ncbi:enoyl-CoA-hydratase DpgB [Actinocorallia aurantiaca]|uniref:(3,5-dihydroxycyclohex-3-enyl)acetyl-CoA dehydratase subunit B n=1 Tax=Actinocorallia aurantiaca TaxID=46204 RepID=A0ABN3UAY1_9ACTN
MSRSTVVIETVVGSADLVTEPLIAAVQDLCDRVEAEDGPVVAVLRVGGPAPDGPDPDGDLVVHLVNRWERALRRLEKLPAPTVALADGLVAGPALETLLSADYRVGTPGVVLRPPVAAGEPWPGMLVHRLAQQVSVARARRFVLFGGALDAETALADGLLDLVTGPEGWDPAGFRLAEGLAGSELAIRRRLLLEAATTSFEEALGAHLAACDRTLRRLRAEVAS